MIDQFLDSCSPAVQAGVKFLENIIIEKKIEYNCTHVELFYVLDKFKSNLAKNFIEESKKDVFWLDKRGYINDWLSEDPHLLWFLAKLGLHDNKFFKEAYVSFKKWQTVEGNIQCNSIGHTGPLRVLTLFEPDSNSTKDAVKYLINNWKGYNTKYNFDLETLFVGILVLSELNFFEYKNLVEEISNLLKTKQNNDGHFGKEYNLIKTTSLAIISLSRILGSNDKHVVKAIKWLKKKQMENGSWKEKEDEKHGSLNNIYNTAYALFALISVGEGPKTSLHQQEWKETLRLQEISYMKPSFLHTSPIYESGTHIKEIYEKTKDMILTAEKEVRIASLFIDVLYEDLINFCNKNQHVNFKIIVRPARDIKGLRQKIGKNVIDLLNIATKGNIRYNELLHCRMLIIDDKEMLVSSSDLTRDQLFDEFNAGIHTKDLNSIKKAISFFDNLWENSEEFQR